MNKAYETYKDSGIEWIGKIPSHWEAIPLRRHISLSKGSKPEDLTDFANGYPYLTMDYLRGRDGKMILYPARTDGLELIDNNEIIVLWDGANAGEFMLSKKGYLGSTMAKINVNQERYNKDYFFLLLKSLEQASKDFANGTTIPHFDSSILNDYYYPCPPLAEQQAIAAYLDEKCGKVDSLVAELEQQLSDLSDLKKSEITRVVTKGLDPNVPLKDSGIDWIGQIPEGWEVRKIKNFLSNETNNIKVGPFGSSLSGNDIDTEGVFWVYNQRTVLDDNFIINNMFVSKEKYNELISFSVFPGDILITTRGTIGKVAIVPSEAPKGILHPCVIRFRIDEMKLLKRFLVYIFNDCDIISDQIKYGSNSTTIEVLYSNTLKDLKLPSPPLEEQQAIADYLDAYCSKIDATISEIKAQIADLKLYKQSLISEAVTGKICVTD